MVLRGDVQSINLPSILQNLAVDEKTGTLTLEEDGRRVHVWLEGGFLRLVGFGNETGPSIADGLVAVGALTPGDLDEARSRSRAAKGETALLRRLAKEFDLSYDMLADALAQQMTEHLTEFILWERASYVFVDGEPRPEHFDLGQRKFGVRLNAESVVMEALRRADELQETRKVVGPLTEIVEVHDSTELEDEDPVAARVLAMIDGQSTVGELIEYSRLGSFAVHKALASLQAKRAVRPLTTDQARERAERLADGGDFEGALKFTCFGLSREPNDATLMEIAARSHHALGMAREAVAQYRHFALIQLDQNQPKRALQAYERIIELAPEDLLAHEQVLELLLSLGMKSEAMQAIKRMTFAAERAGLPDKLRPLYERLIQVIGDDEALLGGLADMERQFGRRSEAVELYKKLLQRAVKRGDDESTARLCASILKLDDSQKEVARTRSQLEAGQLQKARERRRLRRILLPIGGALLLLFAGGLYELGARIDLSSRREQILQATLEARHQDLLALYDDYFDTWPLSFAANELGADRTRVEAIFVKDATQQIESLLANGELIAALREVRTAERLTRNQAHAAKIRELRESLEAERSAEEQQREQQILQMAERVRTDADGGAAAELAALRDPLCVPGLRTCLGDASVQVRQGAVLALGSIEGDDALAALIEALADGEGHISSLAVGLLTKRSGENFGEDRLAWDRWLRLRREQSPALPVLQASLEAKAAKVTAKDRLTVDWRILNMDHRTIRFTLLDPVAGLCVIGPQGRRCQEERPEGGHREVVLYPDDYLGGRFDLRRVFPSTKTPGRYRIEWNALVEIDSKEHEIDAATISVEVVDR